MKGSENSYIPNHWAAIFYIVCPRSTETPGDYLKYQRSLTDRILNQEFINKFGVGFERDKVIKGKYGKPCWPEGDNIFFNISNTSGFLVCALSNIEIGVDAEKIHSIRKSVIHRCCTPEEISYIVGKEYSSESSVAASLGKGECKEEILSRFFQIWTLKESYIKMTGEGLRFPLKQAAFSIQKGGMGRQQICCGQPGFFQQRKLGEYWVSLCTMQKVEAVWQEILPPDREWKEPFLQL